MAVMKSDTDVEVGTIQEFANETTLHGLPRVLKPSNPFKRSVWVLLFSSSIILLIWQASELVNQFLGFRTTVSTNVEQSAIPFPAVTVCNEHGATVSTRDGIAQYISGYNTMDAFARTNYNVYNNITIKEFNKDKCSSPTCQFRQVYLKWFSNIVKMLSTTFQENYRLDGYLLAANLGLNFSALAGIRLQDVVYVCKFDGERCNMKNFIAYHHSNYLLCHTYKTDKFARVGQNRGLSLVLKYDPVSTLLKRINYLPGLSRADISPGYRIYVHPPGESPSLENEGMVFYPGIRASLAFIKTTHSRLGSPYGNCSDRFKLRHSDMKYSPLGCAGEYQQEVIRELCNCTDISLPYEHNDVSRFPFCRKLAFPDECSFNASFWSNVTQYTGRNMDSVPASCIAELWKIYKRLDCMVNASNIAFKRTTKGSLDLGCYPPCNQLKYEVRDTTNVWPSGDGFLQTIGSLATDSTYQRSREMLGYMIRWTEDESALTDFRSKFLQLNVYLKDADVIKNSEDALYSWYQMLSEFGGLLGLYIGMSVMTLCEMFELLFIKLWKCVSSKFYTRTKTKIQTLQ